MKHVFLSLLLTMFLASCTNVTPFAVTVIPQPTSTFTPHPTSTTEPTKTPDPLQGAPKGTTRVSLDGETFYKDVKVGKDNLAYTWDEELKTFFRLLTPQKIPLLDLKKTSNDIGFPDQLWTSVLIDERLSGEQGTLSITHPDILNVGKLDEFSAVIYTDLFNALKKRGFDIKSPFPILTAGVYHFAFTTPEGNFDWQLGPNKIDSRPTTVNVLLRGGYQTLFGAKDPKFFKWKIYKGKSNFLTRVTTDRFGNLNVETLPELSWNELSEREKIAAVLIGPAVVIDDKQVIDPGFPKTLLEFLSAEFDRSTHRFFLVDSSN